ncbi:MAG: ABC transporter ATP-binding protein [candidate division WOR-3 bacterium]
MEKIIVLKNIGKYFKKKKVLDKISFYVKKGEIFGVLGPDGSGKTTLLRIIAGIIKPDEGEIEIKGKISFVSSNFNLYPDLKLKENLEFIREIYNIEKNEFLKRKEKLLEITELKGFEDVLAGNLSGGMKRKLLLIAGILPEPDIILIDEITTGIDPLSRKEIWEFIENLKGDKTIIFSTPYLNEGERAERIIFLEDGKIKFFESPLNIMKEYKVDSLEKAFLKINDRS